MFGNRALQVSMTKTDGTTAAPRTVDRDAVLYYNAVLIANAQRAAIGFVGIYAAVKTVDTISQIAIKLTPTR